MYRQQCFRVIASKNSQQAIHNLLKTFIVEDEGSVHSTSTQFRSKAYSEKRNVSKIPACIDRKEPPKTLTRSHTVKQPSKRNWLLWDIPLDSSKHVESQEPCGIHIQLCACRKLFLHSALWCMSYTMVQSAGITSSDN